MSAFGNNNNFSGNNNDEDSSSSEKKYKWLFELVGDKSVFGRWYTKVCEILKARNVPASRLPSREHFMSRMFACLDQEKLNEWLTKYVELEAIKFEDKNIDDELGPLDDDEDNEGESAFK